MRAVSRKTLLQNAEATLNAAGVEDARRSAEWLLEEALGLSRIGVVFGSDEEVSPKQRERFQRMVERRAGREPVQYILGHADFYGLRLRVTPEVLIPRPETEVLVERVLDTIRARAAPRILDVGTGSGAIALAIKNERPDATVFASDVSGAALDVARKNAEWLELDVTFSRADALAESFLEQIPERLDALVSNPPYVPEAERATLQPEIRDHEPLRALFVPDADSLVFYRALVVQAHCILRPGGCVAVEVHVDLATQVQSLFVARGLESVEIVRDLSGRPRVVTGRRGRHRRA